jgi:hypothetical protein
MSKIIKGTLNVGKTAYSDGKAVITSINGTARDTATNGFTVDAYTSDQLIEMISVLPVSNFVPNSGLVTYTGYNVTFNSANPALLSGNFLMLPITTIDLTKIKTNPASSTFYVYVTMSQGLPKYLITTSVIAEEGANAYNIFWIGTITTNISGISATNIISRSRLDVFSPSTTAAGASFPVSTGLPSQTGNITW